MTSSDDVNRIIILVGQVNELIDLGERYARRMREADPDESKYAQGKITFARAMLAVVQME